MVKNPSANAGDIKDAGLILGLRGSSRGGHGNPLQYSCLKNPMSRGTWQVIVWTSQVHRIAESDTTEMIACIHADILIFLNKSAGSNHRYV